MLMINILYKFRSIFVFHLKRIDRIVRHRRRFKERERIWPKGPRPENNHEYRVPPQNNVQVTHDGHYANGLAILHLCTQNTRKRIDYNKRASHTYANKAFSPSHIDAQRKRQSHAKCPRLS